MRQQTKCNFPSVPRYIFTMNDVEALYRRHAPAVYRFALSLSGSRAAAEDLTSETFVRLWTARDRVDVTTVVGYLFTITRHLYLQGAARDQRRAPLVGWLRRSKTRPVHRSKSRPPEGRSFYPSPS